MSFVSPVKVAEDLRANLPHPTWVQKRALASTGCSCCFCGTTLTCKTCKVHIDRALKVLRQPDSWRCTCKKIRAGKKAHAALYEKIHQQKCPLTPMLAGEDRWDGKNKGVKKQDIILLARSNRY